MDHYHRRGQNRLNDADSSDGGNSALATEVFDHFCTATTLKNVLGLYREMCDILKLRPTNFPLFYPRLKSKLRSWKAQALWKRLDIRAAHKCYDRGRVCLGTRVLVIGAGPCGLRAAIEAQLLGAKVVVIEKRDRITRNNVLHLWPFVIQDLRALGAKKFFGKFCAGAIDHISIRQLQCILLKVALLLGVELHEGVSFEKLVSPTSQEQADRHGWRADVLPADHPVSHYEFDVLIGADGKRNTLEGFKRKEFRGKLAIAITANFKNRHTEAEARVEEISGVAFIFNQKFFKDLYAETGIDLENIVYYKDDTHYFVMTAKKHSLIEKGVIMQDLQDTAKLLAQENVDRDALMEYAREAAEFSTNYQLPDLEFAVNHYGQPDVAMFDFTSMYAAENASRVVERYGYRLLMCLVGDSLLEPFWPTGSGCARGFLSSLDSCWAIRSWGSGSLPLEVLAERESIYRLLGQTTPENLQRDYASYTLDPSSRYPNLNRFCVIPAQVRGLYDSDDPSKIEIPSTAQHVTDKLHGVSELHKKRRKRDSQVHPDTLLHWIKKQVAPYESIIVDDITESFNNGLVLCAVIHRYRPDLIDWGSLVPEDIAKNNQLAFDILEKEMGIPPVMTGLEIEQNTVSDKLTVLSYLSQVYDTFHGEIPHIKHLRLDIREELKKQQELISVRPKPISEIKLHTKDLPSSMSRTSNKYTKTSHMLSAERKRKRRSADKGAEERRAEIAQNRSDRMSRRKMQRHYMTDQFYKSIHMLNTNAKISEDNGPFEDYSIYLYRQVAPNFEDRVKELEQKLLYPDREQRTQEFQKGSIDENFSGRIKNIEQKFKTKSGVVAEKKPPDLLRAIGKIESTDWNIREIEKKMLENKMGKKFNIAQEKEKVPKWSREQFVARQSKLEKKALNRQDSATEKFSAIDSSVKELDKKLKEGSVLEKGIRGNNKVASMAEQFNTKPETEKSTTIQKSTSKSALSLCAKGGSELCHFCGNRVYLMERLSAEGRFFHRGCFRCQYCATSLRLGFYSYDAQNGQKFYCPQHFGMQGKMKVSDKTQKLVIKQSINTSSKEVTDMPMETVKNKGGKTPERIEFSNSIAVGHVSENEEPLSQIDEDEWTDRNFGQSTAEAETSDTTDSDSDEVYDDAFEAIDHGSQLENTGIPLLNISQKKHDNSHGDDSGASDDYDLSSDGFSYYEYSSDDDDASETATEEEEEIKAARELRKQEVQFSKPPPTVADTDTTGSDTEVASDEESETEDSATEISTDSEFKLDGVNLQKDFPEKVLNERNVTKVSQRYLSTKRIPTKIKCNAAEKYKNNAEKLRSNNTEKLQPNNTELNITPIVPDLSILATSKPLLNPHKGFYFLNRTHSTEGIASKVSLELKKQYLLGTAGFSSNIQKSGSASTLDSKLKSFHSNISEHQKLLNPSSTITPSMQAFLDGVSKLHVPLSPTQLKVDKLPDLMTDNFKHVCGLNSAKSDSDCDINSARIISTASPMDTISVQVTNQSKYDSDNDHKFSSDTIQTDSTVKQMNESINDVDARPRSPAHETSIIVPEIPWVHSANKNDSSDDLETDSLSSSDENNLSEKGYHELSHSSSTTNNITVPRLEIIEASEDFYENPIDDIVMDSLHSVPELNEGISSYKSIDSHMDAVKDSINDQELNLVDCDLKSKRNLLFSEPKTLNQPKLLASVTEKLDFQDSKVRDLNNLLINNAQKSSSDVSISSSSSVHDITATVLTETELSDWARDGTVSDNLEDVEFKFDPDYENTPKRKKLKSFKRLSAISATNSHYVKMVDFDGVGHICGKENTKQLLGKPSIQSDIIKNIADLDSIEFMDTASEESGLENLTSATNFTLLKNQGYVQFINVSNNFNKLESNDLPRLKSNENDCKNDQVSRNVIDSEDDYRFYNLNTNYDICQKLSVDKVDTENDDNFSSAFKIRPIEETHHSNDLDQDSLQYSSISTELQTPVVNTTCTKMNKNDLDYIEHVERLKNKMSEFNNVKDSIDVKKSKSKNNSLAKDSTENIRTEIPTLPPRSLNLSFILDSNLSASEKLKEISKERSKEKDLIHEMVMDNFRIQKKLTPGKKCKNPKEKQNLSKDDHESRITFDDKKNVFSNKGQSSEVVEEQKNFILQKSFTDTTLGLQQDSKNSLKYKILEFNPNSSSSILPEHLDTFSLPDVHSTSFDKNYKITNSLLKSRKVEQKKVDEQMHYSSKQSSQQMHIIKSLLRSNPTSPRFSVAFEDEIVKSKSNDTFHRSSSVNDKLMFSVKSTPSSEDVSTNINVSLKSELRPNRTKSFSEISKNKSDSTGIQKSLSGNFLRFTEKTKVESYFKSEPCLLDNRKRSDKKNKNKDGEKRKSIIQAVTDFFYKRRDFESPVNKLKRNSSPVDHSKDKFSFWISPKSRDKLKEKNILTNNTSQIDEIDYTNEAAPPPVPPPPIDYIVMNKLKSDDELNLHKNRSWSIETLEVNENLPSTCDNEKKKIMRRSHHKRLRLAQEIQRKLEETEVKTRELESRGVELEKVLRGEKSISETREESVLLAEWLSLMRERAALRRYERELLAKAEDLRLEEKHSILQAKLHDRSSSEPPSNKNQHADESELFDQMLDIVSKRDSLASLLEKNQQRYMKEDEDLEALILSKGLKTASIKNFDNHKS